MSKLLAQIGWGLVAVLIIPYLWSKNIDKDVTNITSPVVPRRVNGVSTKDTISLDEE
jgi:hypothetical protein